MRSTRRVLLAATIGVAASAGGRTAGAANAQEIDAEVDNALRRLLETNPAAAALAKEAKGILVFPSIIKGGFIVGGLYGEGAMRQAGKTTGYYSTAAASYGLQAGAQTFSYALFFMTDAALHHLDGSAGVKGGWELGVGPSIVVADEGLAGKLSTTTAREGVYAFIFGQKGLMAGIGIEGSKITRITPSA